VGDLDGLNLNPDQQRALGSALIRKAEAEADMAEDALRSRKAQNDYNRHLFIDGVILDTVEERATLARWARRDPGEPITITVNTPGGSVFDGNALVGTIKAIVANGTPVTVIGTGTLMSYGAILLQAGTKRILQKNCVFMLHGIAAPVGGNLEQILNITKMLQRVEDDLLDAMVERAKISRTKIKGMIKNKDLFITAEEALKYGFCDEVV
jgi:ATP-dependent Clp protease, protease subunit